MARKVVQDHQTNVSLKGINKSLNELKKLGKQWNDFDKSIVNSAKQLKSFDAAQKITTNNTRLMATAFASVATVLSVQGIRSIQQTIDETQKLATALNSTAQEVTAIRQTFEQLGGSADDATRAMLTLNRRIGEAQRGVGEAKEAFDGLGLSADKLSQMSTDERLTNVVNALSNVSVETDRADKSFKIFGRSTEKLVGSFTELPRLLEKNRQDFSFMNDEFVAGAKKVEEFNDSFTRIQNLAQAGLQAFVVNLTPNIEKLGDDLSSYLNSEEFQVNLKAVTDTANLVSDKAQSAIGNAFDQWQQIALAVGLGQAAGLAGGAAGGIGIGALQANYDAVADGMKRTTQGYENQLEKITATISRETRELHEIENVIKPLEERRLRGYNITQKEDETYGELIRTREKLSNSIKEQTKKEKELNNTLKMRVDAEKRTMGAGAAFRRGVGAFGTAAAAVSVPLQIATAALTVDSLTFMFTDKHIHEWVQTFANIFYPELVKEGTGIKQRPGALSFSDAQILGMAAANPASAILKLLQGNRTTSMLPLEKQMFYGFENGKVVNLNELDKNTLIDPVTHDISDNFRMQDGVVQQRTFKQNPRLPHVQTTTGWENVDNYTGELVTVGERIKELSETLALPERLPTPVSTPQSKKTPSIDATKFKLSPEELESIDTTSETLFLSNFRIDEALKKRNQLWAESNSKFIEEQKSLSNITRIEDKKMVDFKKSFLGQSLQTEVVFIEKNKKLKELEKTARIQNLQFEIDMNEQLRMTAEDANEWKKEAISAGLLLTDEKIQSMREETFADEEWLLHKQLMIEQGASLDEIALEKERYFRDQMREIIGERLADGQAELDARQLMYDQEAAMRNARNAVMSNLQNVENKMFEKNSSAHKAFFNIMKPIKLANIYMNTTEAANKIYTDTMANSLIPPSLRTPIALALKYSTYASGLADAANLMRTNIGGGRPSATGGGGGGATPSINRPQESAIPRTSISLNVERGSIITADQLVELTQKINEQAHDGIEIEGKII